MNNLKLKKNSALSFYIKGTTPNIKLELKTEKKVFEFDVKNITSKWKKIRIPLKIGKEEKYFGPIKEIVFVFNWQTEKKTGEIFIDDLMIIKEGKK